MRQTVPMQPPDVKEETMQTTNPWTRWTLSTKRQTKTSKTQPTFTGNLHRGAREEVSFASTCKQSQGNLEWSFWSDGRTLYMTMYQLFTGKRDRTPIQLQYGLGYRDVHDLTLKLVGLSRHIYHYRYLTWVAPQSRCWKILTPVIQKSKPKGDPLLAMTKEIRHETTNSHV